MLHAISITITKKWTYSLNHWIGQLLKPTLFIYLSLCLLNNEIFYLSTVNAVTFHVEEMNIPHIKPNEFQIMHSKYPAIPLLCKISRSFMVNVLNSRKREAAKSSKLYNEFYHFKLKYFPTLIVSLNVIFLHLSVSNSVHRGVYTSLGRHTLLGRHTSRQTPPP